MSNLEQEELMATISSPTISVTLPLADFIFHREEMLIGEGKNTEFTCHYD